MAVGDIETALVAAAKGALSGVTFFDENVAGAKPTNAKWAAGFYRPAQPHVESLGQGGLDMHEGIYQIDINYPTNDGTSAAKTDYAAIYAAFKAGNILTSGDQGVRISSCGRPYSRIVSNWFRVSFTIAWWAHVSRA